MLKHIFKLWLLSVCWRLACLVSAKKIGIKKNLILKLSLYLVNIVNLFNCDQNCEIMLSKINAEESDLNLDELNVVPVA